MKIVLVVIVLAVPIFTLIVWPKATYLCGWAITRVLGVALFAITEPLLRVNVWFKEKWEAA